MSSDDDEAFLGNLGDGFALFSGGSAEAADGLGAQVQEHGLTAGRLAAGAVAGAAPE